VSLWRLLPLLHIEGKRIHCQNQHRSLFLPRAEQYKGWIHCHSCRLLVRVRLVFRLQVRRLPRLLPHHNHRPATLQSQPRPIVLRMLLLWSTESRPM
jgi:hypothetical protein